MEDRYFQKIKQEIYESYPEHIEKINELYYVVKHYFDDKFVVAGPFMNFDDAKGYVDIQMSSYYDDMY